MRPNLRQQFKSIVAGIAMGFMTVSSAFGQATLLPDASQRYLNDSGQPVANGKVNYYIPSTTTRKTVWQDAAETTPQANPVLLDNGGKPQPAGQTYGNGCYRQQVLDQNSLVIWDAVTCSTGSGSGTSPAFSEGIMVGAIIPWANTTLPSKYLYANGQSIVRASYPDLLTALTYQINILCTIGIATVSVSTTISDSIPIGAPIESSCFAPGTTVLSKVSGQLTMTSSATTTTSVTATLFPWGDGDRSTTFNVPDLRGRTLVGRNNMGSVTSSVMTAPYYGVNPNAINALGGFASISLNSLNVPTIVSTGTNTIQVFPDGGAGGVPGAPAVGNIGSTTVISNPGSAVPTSTSGSWAGVSSFSANVGITVTSTNTTATAFTLVQPSMTSDYIIKALPDDVPSGPGVTSIQGMTGALSCGSGVSCTAQTISVSISANSISNTQLAQMGAASFKANPTSSTANAQDITLQSLTTLAVPDPTLDFMPIYDHASGTIKKATASSISTSAGVSSYNGLAGALGGVNIQTGNYTIANTDCEKIVQLTSTSLLQISLPAVAGFPAACRVKFKNGSTTRGVKLSGFPTGLTSPNMLWPLQSGEVQIVNGVWTVTVNPGRWKVPNNTTVYINPNLGNNTNDCLDPNTTDGACVTGTQAIRVNAKDYFDLSGVSVFPTANLILQLADNASGGNCTSACYSLTDIAFPALGAEGRNGILIQGNAATPQNVVLADASGYGYNIFRTSVEIRNMQFGQTNCAATPKANSGISVIEGGVVFLQGTIYLGCTNQQQIVVSNGGQLYGNGRPINVVAGGSYFLYVDSGGQANIQSSTVTFSNAPSYSSQTVGAFAGTNVQLGSVTWTNGGTVTGQKYFCRGATTVETDTGSGASIPGSVAGSTGTGCIVF